LPNNLPALIAVDWGTTSFRAYLLDDAGAILDSVESGQGIQNVAKGEHEATLAGFVGNWRRDGASPPILMSGMIGSRQGWVEAPYARAPAGLNEVAAAIVTIDSETLGEIGVAPGVVDDDAGLGPDVMRGEETQIFGALAASGRTDGLFVLPGTHSKWARVDRGRIVSFATYMTGETFAALRNHTILARLMAAGDEDAKGFAAGVRAAETLTAPGELLHAIFMTRTLGLFDRLGAAQLPEYLSGLLVGAEILAGAREKGAAATVIGSPALTKRYCEAGNILGLRLDPAPDGCVALGQLALFKAWRLSAD
jgi:2-dehydro-3-deoxygalactonokinase